MKGKPGNDRKRTVGVYKSYNFRTKDPIIDKVRTAISDAEVTYAHIERKSGVTTTTLRAWFGGKTKRPQHATVNAVLRVIGKELAIVDATDHNYRGKA
jgi:hypothetical protein